VNVGMCMCLGGLCKQIDLTVKNEWGLFPSVYDNPGVDENFPVPQRFIQMGPLGDVRGVHCPPIKRKGSSYKQG
jgi:hypothetical protein